LDATEFPQLLSRSIHENLHKERAATFTKLVQDVKRAPRSRNEFPGVTASGVPGMRIDFLVCATAWLPFPKLDVGDSTPGRPLQNFFFLTDCSLFAVAETVLPNFSTLTPRV